MTARLPEYIDAFRYAEQKLSLEGVVSLMGMARLGGSLSKKEGQVVVLLQFGEDEQKLPYLKGHLETMLVLRCQRCLEPFNYTIKTDFVLGLVRTLEEANALPDYYEPALVEAGELAVSTIIEDELILNLPIVPKHESVHCADHLVLTQVKGKQEEGQESNPFHVLESLKPKQQR